MASKNWQPTIYYTALAVAVPSAFWFGLMTGQEGGREMRMGPMIDCFGLIALVFMSMLSYAVGRYLGEKKSETAIEIERIRANSQ